VEQLLQYYENELARMRGNLREFAKRYPRIAGRRSGRGQFFHDVFCGCSIM